MINLKEETGKIKGFYDDFKKFLNIDKIKKELHSSKYLGVIQKTFGRNVICIFDKLEKKMLLC